ncbi:MAG TPA: alpha/beta hydrolase family protein [Candidatus Cybelea sp.]|nr:alpha/beta hydrolase family protein [Candidatus Cybelea sp.]
MSSFGRTDSLSDPGPVLRFLAYLAFALICLAPAACAQGRAECRSAPSKILGRAVPFCVILPPSYDAEKNARYPILYSLHGLGASSETLLDSGGLDLIADLWQRNKIGEFLIATPEADRTFYVNSPDGRVPYQDFFMREFIPYIESHYRVRAERRYRAISGISMGGYGALRFALLYPNLFGAVSAHSPALVDGGPSDGISPQQATVISRFLGSAFGTPFDPAYWTEESPFTIVRERRRPIGLEIYFDCGLDDSYGFNRGAAAFDKLLTSRGIPHEFHLYPGVHDWAYFAQHLPASLEFHSRAFGLETASR